MPARASGRRPIRIIDYDPAGNTAQSQIASPHGSPDSPARTHESQWRKMRIATHLEAVDDNTIRCISCSKVSFKGIINFMPIFFAIPIRKFSEAAPSCFELLAEIQATGSPS